LTWSGCQPLGDMDRDPVELQVLCRQEAGVPDDDFAGLSTTRGWRQPYSLMLAATFSTAAWGFCGDCPDRANFPDCPPFDGQGLAVLHGLMGKAPAACAVAGWPWSGPDHGHASYSLRLDALQGVRLPPFLGREKPSGRRTVGWITNGPIYRHEAWLKRVAGLEPATLAFRLVPRPQDEVTGQPRSTTELHP
jgi:hypothetical protein